MNDIGYFGVAVLLVIAILVVLELAAALASKHRDDLGW